MGAKALKGIMNNMPKFFLLSKKSNKDRAIAIFLGLLFLSFYVLTAQGSIQSLDGTIMYELTESIVEKGSVAIDNLAGVRGIDGRLYSKYGLGQSLAAVPFYLLGKYLAKLLPLPFAEAYTKKFFVSMLNPVITALTCMLLYAFGIKLGYSRKLAILIAFIFGLGTMAWPYSQSFYSEPLTGLLLLATFYVLMKENLKTKELLLAGVLFSGAIFTRAGSLVAFLAIVVYLALTSKKLHEVGLRVLLFSVPLFGVLAVIFFYNFYRFGNPLQAGYQSEAFTTPLAKGIYGLTLSPGRGIFWYNPLLILSLLGFSQLYRVHKEKALTFLVFILLHLLFYSKWGGWDGGWVWGPRFMLVIVPYLVIFSGVWISRLKSISVAILCILLLLSMAIQFSAVFVSPERYYYQEHIKDPKNHMNKIIYDINYSPLWAQWKSLGIVVENIKDSNFLYELAQEQKMGGISEEEKGKTYFLAHNLAFNSPNLWLFYLWYSGVSRWLIFSVLMLLLTIIGFTGWMILFFLREVS